MNFVILCGGSGSRLWPKSREKYPKQFLSLVNDYTMLQNTVLRIINLINDFELKENSKIYVICNKDHVFIVDEQISSLNLSIPFYIISEPKGRDSGPAICIVSLLMNTDENIFIMPCDHIFDDEEFKISFKKSLEYIDDSIITFGIKPDKPETAYGYIKTNETFDTLNFVEKPNIELAMTYFESNNYLWNAGIFIFKTQNMINCFKKYAHDIYQNCVLTTIGSKIVKNITHLCENTFVNCRAISFDYCIMEYLIKDNDKYIKAKTIPYIGHWNDIGSFSALYNEMTKDNNNNIIKGNVLTLDVIDSYIESESKFTSVIGLKDLIVINMNDSLLICNKDNTQDVKKTIEYLKNKNCIEAFFHDKVYRPWGYFINIDGNDYSKNKVKRIVVYPFKKLSLQSHLKRSEHWVIVEGNAQVTLDEDIILMNNDDYVYIPIKTKHRIENIGNTNLEFVETQIGDYLGEDDIIRYEDDYGRI